MPDLFKVLAQEPLLFKHAGTKTDGIRAMSKERSHVPRPHPAACQKLDIIKGAFDLPEIFRSEKIRRKNFHHRSAGVPSRMDLLRGQGPGKCGDAVFHTILHHVPDQNRHDDECGPGIKRAFKAFHIQDRTGADRQTFF